MRVALATRLPNWWGGGTEADPQESAENPSGTKRALILAGSGRFGDDLHDFPSTSECLRAILDDNGFASEISSEVDEALPELDGPDLLVLNIGAETAPDLALDARDRHGLLGYLDRGGPLLAVHRTCISMPTVPEWEDIIGAVWVRGTTDHTGYGTGHLIVHSSRHPIVATVDDFDIRDDRYCYLRTQDDVLPLVTHEFDGIEHPLLWARSFRAARVVYDALGHDTASFDSPEHREILGRACRWLTGQRL